MSKASRFAIATWAWCLAIAALGVVGCGGASGSAEDDAGRVFRRLGADRTGVDFENALRFDREFNIYTYRNFYNGGGVAIGDVNGDSLPDLYLTANQERNRLYLNRGGMTFEDVTASAGVGGTRGWSTGVAMADVDGDGHLDIYVCNSGWIEGDDRANELFLNRGDGTFREAAEEVGLADRGLSTHAAFFDYDRDGDLDVYLLNNSFEPIGSFNLTKDLRPVRDSVGGDKLFRNLLVESGELAYEDVSTEAGIFGSVIGFGLGITVGDVDLDGWLDMYVSNDFFERDYLYVNQRDGTFREVLTEAVASTSAASMGADMADLTGDGYPEIFVTDMLPATDRRLKLNTTFEDWDNYVNKVENGYFHQFSRNTLQVNRGDGTFSESGRQYGVEASDWSWGALLFDVDTDGDRDLFIANGIYQDLTNQDYIRYLSSDEMIRKVTAGGSVDYELLIDLIPSEPVANAAYLNPGAPPFELADSTLGLSDAGFSNGAAYGDLDNDGDLDLVVNNVNSPAWVYENTAPRDSTRASLRVTLVGEAPNVQAIGARVTAYCGRHVQTVEQVPTRGFQSSVDARPFFGLGQCSRLDSVVVHWPRGGKTVRRGVAAGAITLRESTAVRAADTGAHAVAPVRRPYTPVDPVALGVEFVHEEDRFADFSQERLAYQMNSTVGPGLAVGDVDGDGREDLFVSGGADQAGVLYLQGASGRLGRRDVSALARDAKYEDVTAEFADLDGDGDLDLLVGAGSSRFDESQLRMTDRAYLNDGRGDFARAPSSFLDLREGFTSALTSGDLDGDGEVDVFRGTRMRPRAYGVPAGADLRLGGDSGFSPVRDSLLRTLGMITDAAFADLDADGRDELVVATEWGTVQVLTWRDGRLSRMAGTGLDAVHGWWSALLVDDVDGDGDADILVGNHGTNSRFRASAAQPVTMVVGDFDGNGTAEQIVSRYLGDTSLPISLRHDLVAQMPSLQKKYLKYDSYFGKSVEDILTADQLAAALSYAADELRTGVFVNDGSGAFAFVPFGPAAQQAPTYAIAALPEGAGYVLGGNLYGVKPELGRYDASRGAIVDYDDEGGATATPGIEVGLDLPGEIREVATIEIGGLDYVIAARSGAGPLIFQHNPTDDRDASASVQ